jgi:ribosomal protein S18 acetylase RimI-like enzyme
MKAPGDRSMSVVIRDVQRHDRSQWQALWDDYNAFYGRAGPTALDPAVTELTWARFFDPASPVNCLVAVRGEAVVGLVHHIFHASTTRATDVCYLQDLITCASLRGKGIGRMLIEAVAAAARRAGCSRVYWQTKSDNQTARALYDKVGEHSGFIVYSRELGAAP